MNVPADLKYTKDHEWVKIDGDTVTVGITDFAQGELGDIVYVEVESLDETLEAGCRFWNCRSRQNRFRFVFASRW